MKISPQNYTPPGPVGAGFLKSRGPIDLIMGPAGSGKTVCSVLKGPLLAAEYMPVCKDGWVRHKHVNIRDTYRDFSRTFLESWYDMFPPSHPWTIKHEGGQDRPVKHHLRWKAVRGGDEIICDFQMETGAIGDHNIEQFIKGYEISTGALNELDMLDRRVLGLLFQRTGRYPKVVDIAPQELDRVSRDGRAKLRSMGLTVDEGEIVLPRMAWGDFNPPDIDNYLYEICVKEPMPGLNFHVQPGGLEQHAENRVGKPRSSYELEAVTQPDHIVRRMVHGQFGYSLDGKPIYPEFNHQLHVSDAPLDPMKGVPLSIGMDAGGSPAATIGQNLPNGQNRLLREVCTEPGTGPSRFAEAVLELLLSDFAGIPIAETYVDPSAFYGADKQNNEFSWVETVARALNLNIEPAPSNEVSLRHESVRWYLTGLIDGNTPRYLIDPRCERMIGGFAAHYKQTKQSTEGRTDKLVVDKNPYSHPHDAEQYRNLGHRGRQGVIVGASNLGRPNNVVSMQRGQRAGKPAGSFNVFEC